MTLVVVTLFDIQTIALFDAGYHDEAILIVRSPGVKQPCSFVQVGGAVVILGVILSVYI